MIRLTFRAAASADMRSLARETKARWGTAQAAIYSAKLRDDIKSLREFPLRFASPNTNPAPACAG